MTRHPGNFSNPGRWVLSASNAWFLVLLSANCCASDWPGWRGPFRDGHVPSGVAVPETLPREPRRVWQAKIGAGFASPVVAGNRVFYLDAQEKKEVLHAVERDTGRECWQSLLDDVFKDFQSAAGPRCTPLVDGDRVYALSCKGELRCLAVADGKLNWRVNFSKDFKAEAPVERDTMQGAHRHGHTGSPWVEGNRLLAFVGDTHGAGIVCFEKQTGAVLWRSQNDEAGNAPPITAHIAGTEPKQVVAFTAEGLIGLNLEDGGLLWRVPLSSTYGRHVTTPVVVSNIVIVASRERGMVAVEVTRQSVATGAANSSNSVAAVKWNARIKWDSMDFAMNFSSPVAVGEYVYGLGPDREIFCAEARTGKAMWSKRGYTPTEPENSHAALLAMGKNLLLLTDTGELVLFAANPTAFKELGRVQVCGVNWCNPAYADGRLFLRDARELVCVELLP